MLVEVKNNDINGALKKLKKKVFMEKILLDYRAKQEFIKPSQKRRLKHAEAVRNERRRQRERRAERGF